MRTENTNKELLLSREAAAAITRNRFCKDVGANKVQMVGAGEKASCISRYDAEAGRAASSQYGPSTNLVESGGLVADNTEVVAGADGVALDIAAGASGAWVLGKTTHGSSSTAAGQNLTIDFYGERAYQKA